MDAALKYKIVEKIIQSEDDAVLNKIKSLLGIQDKDFWHELPLQVQQQINQAKQELDDGKGVLHEDVMAEINRFIQ